MAFKYPLVSNSSTLTIEELPSGDELVLDNLTVPGNASISGNANVGNLGTSGSITATGNVTGGNINFGSGRVSGTGNVYAANFIGNISGNIDAAGSNTQVQFNDTNDILGASAGFTFDKTSNAVVITGNVTGGNLITVGIANVATLAVTGIASVTGNANVGNLGTAGLITATGNITGGNLITAGLATVTGNITGGNVTTAGTANIATLAVTGTSSHTGNATFGNVSGTGSASFTGNVSGGNVLTSSIVGTGITITSTGALNLAPTGNITANSKNINNLADPAAAQDAATKSYVDSVAQGLDTKASVVAATTATITLSGTQTVDGIVLVATDRVLVKNQTLSQNNGIYLCAAGAWTRTTDMDTWDEVPGAYVFVEGGTANADTGWVCTSDAGGTLGTTAIVWAQFSGAGSYTAGTGLTLTGTVFSVNAAQSQITSVGTLGSLTVTGNTTSGNLLTGGLISATGNVTGNYFLGNGSQLSGIDATSIQSGTSNVRVVSSGGNVTVGVGGISNVAVLATTGVYITGVVSASGNITGGNLITGGLITSTGNITGGNLSGTSIVGTLTTAAQTNITSVGTLTSLAVTGNIAAGNLSGTSIVGTLTTAAQTNITSVGTLGSLSVTGNVTANILKTANISIDLDSLDATANLSITAPLGKTISMYSGDGSEVDLTSTGVAIKTVTGLTTYTWAFDTSGNLTLPTGGALTSTGNISTTGNVTGNYILGNGSQLTSLPGVSNLSNGNSNVAIASAGGDVQIAVNGGANTVVIGQGSINVLGPMATAKTITANSVVAADMNAILISPVTINDGISVTVPTSSTLYIFTPA